MLLTNLTTGLRLFEIVPTFPTYLGFKSLQMPKNPTFPDCFDHVEQVTITSLKRLGYFQPTGTVRGSYGWTCNGESTGRITISVNLTEKYVELDYLRYERPYNYRVRLECIPAHFGGYNWYFICPATGRRCSKLYGIGDQFLSRFAYPDTMYSKQIESKSGREMIKVLMCRELRREHLSKRHARTKYKGKITKRYSRILDKADRIDFEKVQRFFNDKGWDGFQL